MSEIKDEYKNYKVIKREFILEINSNAILLEHIKTGASIVKFENDDNDNAFIIGFKTIPNDDTGCPHILEHSVLCGSKKFPVKDPFSTINRSSILTFSNAFTFPDKTIYPFSTTNKSEFFKVMEIYLDSVFAPNVVFDKKIFLQEGWRYELENINDDLKYTGVVYGEMMGATSSAMDIIEYSSMKFLFPDTNYSYEYGGAPLAIPNLTYEDFIDFYNKYYHPSNSFIYLYGDGNLDEELDFIDKEYLSKYEKLDNNKFSDIKIDKQIEFNKEKFEVVKYAVSKEEKDLDNKNYFVYNWCVCDSLDYKKVLSYEILYEILFGTNASPLKKALIEAKIGEDVICKFEEEIFQPFYQLTIINANKEKKDLFKKIIYDKLNEILKLGIDKNLIIAAIQKIEFDLKEQIDYSDNLPKGLMFGREIFKSWLYGADPFIYIKFEKVLLELKKMVNNDNNMENLDNNLNDSNNISNYFLNLIKEGLIENNHKSFFILEPDKNLDFEKEVKDKLSIIKKNMSNEELEEIINQTKLINQWQKMPDLEENIKTIKTIKKDDINPLPIKYELNEKNINNIKIYQFKEKSTGITYMNLFFDANKINSDKLQYLSLFTKVLSKVKTINYDYDDFSNLINTYTGGINFNLLGYYENKNKLKSKFLISIKFIDELNNKGVEILNEIINNVIFDEEKVFEILQKIKARTQINLIEAGHQSVVGSIASSISQSGKFKSLISGFEFYDFICSLIENYDNVKDDLLNELNEIYQQIFNKDNLIININSKLENLDFINNLNLKNSTKNKTYDYNFNLVLDNLAIKTSAKVNYVGKGFNYKYLDFDFHGSFHALKNILRYGYLWDEIRVKKGAYGSGIIFTRFENFIFWSYRDPNIISTLETYDKTSNYLKNINSNEIFNFVVGAISDLDKPLDSDSIGFIQTLNILQNINYDDLIIERKQLLQTSKEDLINIGNILDKGMKKGVICVLGNQNMIEKNKKLFDKIREI